MVVVGAVGAAAVAPLHFAAVAAGESSGAAWPWAWTWWPSSFSTWQQQRRPEAFLGLGDALFCGAAVALLLLPLLDLPPLPVLDRLLGLRWAAG